LANLKKSCTFVQRKNKEMSQKLVRFDWAMKNLLRNKANYDIVEGFLCALLEDNDLQVLEVLESEGNKENEDDKFNRVDVVVKDNLGRKILIEIQNTKETDYLFRMVYSTSKSVSESIESGDKYREIDKVISVSILYFDLEIGEDYLYYGQTEFKGLNTNEIINKNSEKVQKLIPKGAKYNGVEIFPEYYLIQVKKYQNVVKKAIDEWVYWFKNEKVAEGSHSKHIQKVVERLEVLKMNNIERKNYERFLEKLASEKDMVQTSRDEGYEEAQKELLPLLKQERKEKEQERKEKEIKDQQLKQAISKIEKMVIKLNQKGFTDEEIAEYLEISLQEVKRILIK
jgi:predicted transposase/invertase (TIGR01784 family)